MKSEPFAEIVVLSPVKASLASPARPGFTYRVPDELSDSLATGSLVIVPFGPRRLYGIVIALRGTSPVVDTRPVESVVDPDPVVTPAQLALAHWMAREHLTPLWRCLKLMLPPGVVGHADIWVSLGEQSTPGDTRTLAQEQLFEVLDRRGPLRGRQLNRILPRDQWQRAASQLSRRGVVVKSPFLARPTIRPKQVRSVEWIGGDIDTDEALSGLRSECYGTVVDFLRSENGPVEASWVYAETGCKRYHLNKLAHRDLIAFDAEEIWRDPLGDDTFVPDSPPTLTSDQQAVWNTIQSAIRGAEPHSFLLHGVTGSGKTEIYMRAAAEVLARGKQAIVLVPEISLTPQTAHRFGARFGRRIVILHSALSPGQRYDTWRQVRAGLKEIAIGPRSALFLPFRDLGLIVLDEEHDGSYKEEPVDFARQTTVSRASVAPVLPPYHARDTAQELAAIGSATVILGSATPSLESYYRAVRGDMTLLEMPRRIMGHTCRIAELQSRFRLPRTNFRNLQNEPDEARYLPLPAVQIVDMRAELRADNRSIFSRTLERAIGNALAEGGQVILLLNRRGSATFVLCRDCGHVLRCPQCETPLTYHGAQTARLRPTSDAQLVCHHCNHHESQPNRCPACRGSRIRYFGLGTERVEQTVTDLWPDVRTLRWDRDTARNHAAHAAILHLFSSGLAQVLVGTQMVAKGLDVPRVTLVGVISADTALNLPDFRSGERTFQLLAQVAGRAGRGLLGGRVVIQTYHPDHYALLAAADHNYAGFVTQELAFRREQRYPPFVRLTKLLYEDASPSRAEAEAEALFQVLRQAMARRGLKASNLIGPVPAFFARLRGRYRWQILLRHPNPASLLRAIRIPPAWRVDVDPVTVL